MDTRPRKPTCCLMPILYLACNIAGMEGNQLVIPQGSATMPNETLPFPEGVEMVRFRDIFCTMGVRATTADLPAIFEHFYRGFFNSSKCGVDSPFSTGTGKEKRETGVCNAQNPCDDGTSCQTCVKLMNVIDPVTSGSYTAHPVKLPWYQGGQYQTVYEAYCDDTESNAPQECDGTCHPQKKDQLILLSAQPINDVADLLNAQMWFQNVPFDNHCKCDKSALKK